MVEVSNVLNHVCGHLLMAPDIERKGNLGACYAKEGLNHYLQHFIQLKNICIKCSTKMYHLQSQIQSRNWNCKWLQIIFNQQEAFDLETGVVIESSKRVDPNQFAPGCARGRNSLSKTWLKGPWPTSWSSPVCSQPKASEHKNQGWIGALYSTKNCSKDILSCM